MKRVLLCAVLRHIRSVWWRLGEALFWILESKARMQICEECGGSSAECGLFGRCDVCGRNLCDGCGWHPPGGIR